MREPNGGRNKRSGEKKARKSKHLRTDKNGDIFTGSKNLGNVVLVKNTKLGEVHKEQKKVTPPPQPLLRSQERQRKSADTYLQTSTQPEAHMRGTASSNKTRRTCERSPSVVCSTTFQDRHFKCKKQLKSADKPQFCLAKNMKLLPKAKVFHSHGEANDTHSAKNDVLNGLEEVEETGNDITRNEKSEGGV